MVLGFGGGGGCSETSGCARGPWRRETLGTLTTHPENPCICRTNKATNLDCSNRVCFVRQAWYDEGDNRDHPGARSRPGVPYSDIAKSLQATQGGSGAEGDGNGAAAWWLGLWAFLSGGTGLSEPSTTANDSANGHTGNEDGATSPSGSSSSNGNGNGMTMTYGSNGNSNGNGTGYVYDAAAPGTSSSDDTWGKAETRGSVPSAEPSSSNSGTSEGLHLRVEAPGGAAGAAAGNGGSAGGADRQRSGAAATTSGSTGGGAGGWPGGNILHMSRGTQRAVGSFMIITPVGGSRAALRGPGRGSARGSAWVRTRRVVGA